MNIIVCANFRPEIEMVFGESDEELVFYDSLNCMKKNGEIFDRERFKPEDTVIIGGQCLKQLSSTEEYKEYDFKLYDNCFYQLLNEPIVDKYINAGNYIVSEGWLLNWPENLSRMGFNQTGAVDFWSQFPGEIVFLNTNARRICTEISDFSQFLDKKFSVVDVGLFNYENAVKNVYFEKKNQYEKKKFKKVENIIRREICDYQLSFDLVQEIIHLDSTEEVVREILNLILIFAGAVNVSYLPDEVSKEIFITDSIVDREVFKSVKLLKSENRQWIYLDDISSILFPLNYQDRRIGVIIIESIQFPQYVDSYKELFLRLSSLFSVLIMNVKNYEKIKIAERRLNEQHKQLKRAYKAVSESTKTKEYFIAKTSHEIRNPLTGIIGLSGQLQKEIDITKIKKMSSQIDEAGKHLLYIIEDLLNYSKFSSVNINLSYSNFLIEDVLNAVLQSNRILVDELNIEVRTLITPQNYLFCSDSHRIQQVIENLFVNALKYSGSKIIEIEILIKDGLDIIIKDFGIGIPEDKAERIFEPFYRLDENKTGTGLGLTITKEIVSAMNGSISLEATPGGGSTFHVALPFSNTSGSECE